MLSQLQRNNLIPLNQSLNTILLPDSAPVHAEDYARKFITDMANICLPAYSVVFQLKSDPQEESKVAQDPSLAEMISSVVKDFDETLKQADVAARAKLKKLESELSQD